MENTDPLSILGTYDLNKLKELRDAATSKIKKIREKKTIRIPAYIPAELHSSLDIAVEYAFLNNFIKKQTRWAFAKFAVANTIKLIINQKNQEDAQKALLVNQEIPNIAPNEIIPNSPIEEYPR